MKITKRINLENIVSISNMVIVNCKACGKEKEISRWKFEQSKTKTFYCNRGCWKLVPWNDSLKGCYMQSEESNQKRSETLSGKKQSEESNEKRSETMKRRAIEFPETIRSGKTHPMYGKIHSEESKKKMSNSLIEAYSKDPTYRQRISDAHKGKEISEEIRIKLSIAGKDRVQSEETKKKCSETKKSRYASGETVHYMLGKHHTEETKQKIGGANRYRIATEETRKKISESGKGRISHNKGMVGVYRHTDEAKKKISDASKLLWGNEDHRNNIVDKMTGDNHYLYRYSIIDKNTFERDYPLEFNNKLREIIRKRDSNVCQWCDRTELENGSRLTVHHVDYMKTNLVDTNLITLCRKCNSMINGKNRQYWTNCFDFLMQLKEKQNRILTYSNL